MPEYGYMVSETKAQRRQDEAVAAERRRITEKLGRILDANERHENTGLYGQIAGYIHDLRKGSDHAG